MGAGRDTGGVGGDEIDFFVSHAGADRAWAEWVAWQLAEAGTALSWMCGIGRRAGIS